MSDKWNEEPVFITFGDEHLAGVITRPGEPNGIALVILWGAGPFPSSGPNQVKARMARVLAEEGYHCLRFDYMGVGESSGEYKSPSMSTPYIDQILAASRWLEAEGFGQTILIGNCFGAWSALMAAPSVTGLEGLVMSSPPIWRTHTQTRAANARPRWWLRRIRGLQLSKLKSARHRQAYRNLVKAKLNSMVGSGSHDSRFVDAVQALGERGVPTLLLHQDDDFSRDLRDELERGLRDIMDNAPDPARVVRLEGSVSASISTQFALIEAVKLWLRELHTSKARQAT